jgi:GH43 family beta-xylosidase
MIRLVAALLLASLVAAAQGTFTNPLLPAGADPWSIYKEGWYYYTHTTGKNITLWRTDNLATLSKAESKVVWTPPPDTAYSKEIWAPELHFISGKWYLYFAADDGRNRNHRLWVLENASPDPLAGNWVMKGKLSTPDDRWAIDGTVFQHQGQFYLVWSGWEGTENGRQDLFIAKMSNAWTTTGPRVRISTPEFPWEKVGDIAKPGPDDKPHVDVNEGPQPLIRNGRVFIIYSASGCWTEHYALGLIYADAASDLLNPASWKKLPDPIFKAYGKNAQATFAAGHNSFFQSPDGTEDWILYHANPAPGLGCGGKRSPRAQPFGWTAEGFPDFGDPVAAGVSLAIPSQRKAAAASSGR